MKPKIVSVFSGVGGIDIGFHKAGFDIVHASDIWNIACKSLKENFPNTEVVCDSVQFLETKPRDKYEEQQYHSQSTYNPNQYQQPTQNQQQDSFMNENPPFNIMEDDIQF